MRRRILLIALVLAGCTPQERAQATPEEQVLIERILRDSGVQLIELDRNGPEGRLVVSTSQGRSIVRYILAPDDDAPVGELRIRRLRDEAVIETVPPEHPSLSPDRRK